MLTALSIRNIILIESLDLQFQQGLCVLTGETGAGKSILLDALGFALGGRGSSRLLRAGASQGSATAIFDITHHHAILAMLEEQGITHDGELILRRVLYENGKSRAFLNDAPVSASFMAALATKLVEVHGQHDAKGLLDPSTNRNALDQFSDHATLLDEVHQAYHRYRDAAQEYETVQSKQHESEAQLDYLRFVVSELEQLAPVAGEEEALETKRKRLMHKEKETDTIKETIALLDGDVTLEQRIRQAQGGLARQVDLIPEFSSIMDMLERSAIELGEGLAALEKLLQETDEEDEPLEVIEERLFALKNTARKYNVPVDGLVDFCTQTQEKLSLIDNADSHLEALKQTMDHAQAAFIKSAEALSKSRQEAALKLEEALYKELVPLKMENTRFKVAMETLPEHLWSAKGVDAIHFTASTNPGAPLAALSKIASGGELSRFMLAMKVVLQQASSVPCMIFDEVDTGIGGAVADAVGKRLQCLGASLQVLVITHQPQVAAKGHYHFKITKQQQKDTTTTSVSILTRKQREDEVARMLAGAKITDQARSAALSLLGG